jgi:hypothetical protein
LIGHSAKNRREESTGETHRRDQRPDLPPLDLELSD